MSDRVVVVLARGSMQLPAGLVAAMLGDVVDLVAETPLVVPALAVEAGYVASPEALTWPGTVIAEVTANPCVAEVVATVAGAHEGFAGAVAVLAADVPDLPMLLIGKLFSALAGPRGAAVAVCPAELGGLVAIAVNLPLADWFAATAVRLDDADALAVLRRTAPLSELSVGPGWRRVREPGDVANLDPGLEGWDATRGYLA